MPVSVLITVTDAPGMAAWAVSVTVPLMDPAPDVCAFAMTPAMVRKIAAKASTAKHRRGQRLCNFFIFLALLKGVGDPEVASCYHVNALPQKNLYCP